MHTDAVGLVHLDCFDVHYFHVLASPVSLDAKFPDMKFAPAKVRLTTGATKTLSDAKKHASLGQQVWPSSVYGTNSNQSANNTN